MTRAPGSSAFCPSKMVLAAEPYWRAPAICVAVFPWAPAYVIVSAREALIGEGEGVLRRGSLPRGAARRARPRRRCWPPRRRGSDGRGDRGGQDRVHRWPARRGRAGRCPSGRFGSSGEAELLQPADEGRREEVARARAECMAHASLSACCVPRRRRRPWVRGQSPGGRGSSPVRAAGEHDPACAVTVCRAQDPRASSRASEGLHPLPSRCRPSRCEASRCPSARARARRRRRPGRCSPSPPPPARARAQHEGAGPRPRGSCSWPRPSRGTRSPPRSSPPGGRCARCTRPASGHRSSTT